MVSSTATPYSKRKRYSDAKRTLELVIDAQEVISAGLQEIADTRKLLEDGQEGKEKNQVKGTGEKKSGKSMAYYFRLSRKKR